MSITDSTTTDAVSPTVTSFGSIGESQLPSRPQPTPSAKKTYVRPTMHIDVLPGPVLCASQGGGGGTDPNNPNCPPWLPNC